MNNLSLLLMSTLCIGAPLSTSLALPPLRPSVEDPATGLNVPPGFAVEMLYKVDKDTFGSWISMAFDGRGRLVVSDQGNKGTFRLPVPEIGGTVSPDQITKLPIKSSQYGMLFAFGHLYTSGNKVLTRAPVLESGELGPQETISELNGGGEHGPHSIIVSEDGKSLYVIAGNMTRVPEHQKSRIQENMRDDVLLKNYAYGHNGGGKAPGGYVLKVSPDGTERELISMGYRNPVDFALNRHGELFVYDADMEWDVGAPWYRPTRVNHATSGSENGWRATSKKWRKYFPDTVGSVVDLGPGCPTGVIAGTDAKFPTHYRDALFLCDWTFATMYSVHLTPKGSSYVGEAREFISNTKGSLPLTDVVIGPDGHMYFCIGGRNGQSYLYRVRYTGQDSTALSKLDDTGAEARETRHMLESFHGHPDPKALAAVWPHLGSDDYHIRYAARIAIEWQDPASWADKAYHEPDDLTAIHALLGLSRSDLEGSLPPILARLNKVEFKKLDKAGKLALLRTHAVTMSRHGMPSDELKKAVGDRLDPHFPSDDDHLNEELCRVLSYLEHPSVVAKTVALMKVTETEAADFNAEIMKRNQGYGGRILKSLENAPNILNIHYLFCLKDVKTGWRMKDRKFYLGWVQDQLTKSGGNMYSGYLQKIREDAIASVPEKDKVALQYLMGEIKAIDLTKLPKAKGPGEAWTVDLALKVLNEEPLRGRSLDNGRKMFSAGLCVACHRFGQEGGGAGPDLTNLAKRSDYKSIMESILDPSLVISDQWVQHETTLKDGSTVTGRSVSDQDGVLSILQSGFEPTKLTEIKRADVVSQKPSKVSMMPPALIHSMNAEELKDLVAYFISQGDSKHPVHKKPKSTKKLNIELTRAMYGVAGDPKKQIDVSKSIQQHLDARDYDFKMTNAVAGRDPAPGVVKVLSLTYKLDGKLIEKTIPENGTVPFAD